MVRIVPRSEIGYVGGVPGGRHVPLSQRRFFVAHWPVMSARDERQWARDIERMHRNQGWAMAPGYNYLVGQSGIVYEGAGRDTRGIHSPPRNTDGIGVCFLQPSTAAGVPTAPMSQAMRNAGRELYEQLCQQAGRRLTMSWHGQHFATACLPVDHTEVLTDHGWLHLDEVTVDHRVASVAVETGVVTFDRPLAFVEPYEAETVLIGGPRSAFEMTGDHRVPIHGRPRGAWKMRQAADLTTTTRWSARSGGVRGDAPGIGIDLDVLRLLVWVQADGHYQRKNGRFEAVDFHLRKQRKIERVGGILDRLRKRYSLRHRSDGTTTIRVYGVEWLNEHIRRWLPDKCFGWWLLDANADEFAAVDGEILLADGSEASGLYHSADRINIDVIAALYAVHGVAVTEQPAWTDERHRPAYRLNIGYHRSPEATRVVGSARPSGRSALVSCLTTVNDTLLIRQNGRTLVVGNCPGPDVRAWVQAGMPATGGAIPPPPPSEELTVAQIDQILRRLDQIERQIQNNTGVAAVRGSNNVVHLMSGSGRIVVHPPGNSGITAAGVLNVLRVLGMVGPGTQGAPKIDDAVINRFPVIGNPHGQ